MAENGPPQPTVASPYALALERLQWQWSTLRTQHGAAVSASNAAQTMRNKQVAAYTAAATKIHSHRNLINQVVVSRKGEGGVTAQRLHSQVESAYK